MSIFESGCSKQSAKTLKVTRTMEVSKSKTTLITMGNSTGEKFDRILYFLDIMEGNSCIK